MGRSRRKALPEVLRDLRPEDIPEGYGDFWHGRGEIDANLEGWSGFSARDRANLLFPFLWSAQLHAPDGSKRLLELGNINTRQKETRQLAEKMAMSKVAGELLRLYFEWKENVADSIFQSVVRALERSYPEVDSEKKLLEIWARFLHSAWPDLRVNLIKQQLPTLPKADAELLSDSMPEPRYILFQGAPHRIAEAPEEAIVSLQKSDLETGQ